MSTKIYDGIEIKYGDYLYLNNLVNSMRKELIPIAKVELGKIKAKMLEGAIAYMQTGIQLDCGIDDWNKLKTLIAEPTSISRLSFFVDCEMSKIIKKNQKAITIDEYDGDFDMDVKVVVMPIPGKLLGIYYIKNPSLEKTFLEREEIAEYGYWNNVDKPDKVSDEEWDMRKEDWDKALPGLGVPSLNGFEYSIVDTLRDIYTWTIDLNTEILPYLTPNDELKTKLAKMHLLGVKMDEFKESDPDEYEHNPMRIYFNARDYVREHTDEVAEIAKTLNTDPKKFIEDEIKKDS